MDETQTPTPETASDIWAPWRARVAASRRRRDDRVQEWQQNVELRKGSIGRTADAYNRIAVRSEGRISINQDWPLTKAKIAQLYSQTPEVRLTPRHDQFAPAVPVFGRILNDTIQDSSVGTAIEEVLADVVNASGIGGVLIACDKRTEPRDVPIVDPATLPPGMQAAIMASEVQIPTETVDHVVDVQYPCARISPPDLLIPSDFTGSNYDQARWLGHDGRMTWSQAVLALHLDETVQEQVLGADKRAGGTTHSLNTDEATFKDTEVVNFTEVFYWRHYYHPEETSFKAIQRVVFVDGLDEPVINEPFVGQQRLESGGMVGVTKLPIRILTLTYISDENLPPSDSSIGRFQVDELEASRDAMVQQRKHSVPIRWGDTNRVSPNMRAKLDEGTYQGFIWTNGPGERAVGEVARAAFPAERFEFDRVIKSDLTEIWQVGTNQAGAFASGERSASEARIIQQNFATRVGQERDKVTKFFVGIAECLAGLLAIYGQFELPEDIGASVGPDGAARLATWDRTQIAGEFTYSVRVDSTVLLDAEQRIEQLQRFLNLTAESGYLNPKPVIEEMAELSGLDPAKVVIDPKPKPPEAVKISVSKAEDLNNLLFVASLMATGQAPSPEHIAAAKKLMQEAGLPTMSVVPPSPTDDRPPSEVDRPTDWETAPRIERRAEDFGA